MDFQKWASEQRVAELLTMSRVVLAELTRRGILRTANAPAGDLAEYLVASAYEGELAPNSKKSWDVRTNDGRKLQVKCRVTDAPRGGQLFSPFRSFDFDGRCLSFLARPIYLSPARLSFRLKP